MNMLDKPKTRLKAVPSNQYKYITRQKRKRKCGCGGRWVYNRKDSHL